MAASDAGADLAPLLDFTLLRPETTEAEFLRFCAEARELGVGTVCVSPWVVPFVRRELEGSGITVGTVAGFPFGTGSPWEKARETEVLVAEGAEEFDMVLNVGALRGGDDALVTEDIRGVVRAAAGRVVKVILEVGFLTDAEVERGCALVEAAGAHFVKTSTGFTAGGATVERVRLMRRCVGDRLGVKAAGGIRDRATALEMVEAGASRIGTSTAAALLRGR